MTLADLFHKKENQKRHRDGYDASLGMGMHKTSTVGEFIASADPVRVLAESAALTSKDEASLAYMANPKTTYEVKACIEDLKVIGKSEFRMLIRWRSALVEEMAAAAAAAEEENDVTVEVKGGAEDDSESEDEEAREQEIDEELTQANRCSMQRRSGRRKRAKEHAKMQHRRDLGLINQGFNPEEQEAL